MPLIRISSLTDLSGRQFDAVDGKLIETRLERRTQE